jgi:uncharacterized protein YbjT (DUF2867 family)
MAQDGASEATVLLTGGTGTLGRAVHEELKADGARVRILSRRPRPKDVDAADWATGDLRKNEGLAEAVDGADVIVHCATAPRGDVAAAKNLIAAAKATSARPHLVYISIVGIDDVPMFYYRSKREVEDLVASAELPWTTVRATQFHDLVYSMFAGQRRLPLLMFAPSIRFQPIDVRDVASRLGEIVDKPAAGRVPDIGGPEVRTAEDLAAAYSKAAHRRRRIVPVSLPGGTFAAYREGHNLAPSDVFGTITFEQHLADRELAN